MKITNHIPLIKTTYKVGQQLAVTLSIPDKQVFKRAVLVEYLKQISGQLVLLHKRLQTERTMTRNSLNLLFQTPPNCAFGTMVVVKESEITGPGWSVEEPLRAVISGVFLVERS